MDGRKFDVPGEGGEDSRRSDKQRAGYSWLHRRALIRGSGEIYRFVGNAKLSNEFHPHGSDLPMPGKRHAARFIIFFFFRTTNFIVQVAASTSHFVLFNPLRVKSISQVSLRTQIKQI